MNLWVIFLTGLTTGGLSCLAVQGGLLASAMATPTMVHVESHSYGKKRKSAANNRSQRTGIQMAKDPLPVVYFLVGKIAAYTLLGFLLGTLGSAFQITPTFQGVMQLIAGAYMLGTALNMMNVHPIFRYFVIQPPKVFTRFIRNQAKSQQVFTPVLLGILTILIPCGTTQAMAVLAISSSNAIAGALIMFVFTLGTSPTFFVLGFLASQLQGKTQRLFAVVTTILILVLGLVSLDSGLNLLGFRYSPSRVIASVIYGNPHTVRSSQSTIVNGVQQITIEARPDGYYPNRLQAKSGLPLRIIFVSENNYGCSAGIVIPSLGIREFLPNTGERVFDVPPQPAGDLVFSCSMGMFTGSIQLS